MDASILTSLPPGIVLGLVKKKFNKAAGFKVKTAVIETDYPKDFFKITFADGVNERGEAGKASDFSDFSEILISKVKGQIADCKTIHVFKVFLNMEEKTGAAEIYYETNGGEFLFQKFDSLF